MNVLSANKKVRSATSEVSERFTEQGWFYLYKFNVITFTSKEKKKQKQQKHTDA